MKEAVVDTSALLASLDESYAEHSALAEVLANGSYQLILSPFVVAEADYMLESRLGARAAKAFHRDIVAGAYRLAPWDSGDHALALAVCERYSKEYLGIADAANVVVAARWNTTVILTLDQRHFRTLAPLSCGTAFSLFPYDLPNRRQT